MSDGTSLIDANTAILIGIAVTVIFSVLSAYFSFKAATEGTRAQRAFKIAEFRQAWINALREELAILYAEATAGNNELAWDNPSVRKSYMTILLLMNPKDKDYIELKKLCDDYMLSSGNETEDGDDITIDEKLGDISQRILKREWDRLKCDLRQLKV